MPKGIRQGRFDAALAALRTQVADRSPHDILPGERKLAATLSVSRTTVRRLLATLAADGIVAQRHGVGTFVGPGAERRTGSGPAVGGPEVVRGFTETVRRYGRIAATREIEVARALPVPDEAQMLGLPGREEVLRVTRLRCVDGHPVALDVAMVPRWVLDEEDARQDSLYATLASRGFVAVRSLQRVRVGAARQTEATALGLASEAPVAVLRRTDYLQDGRCCAFTRSVVRADHFDLLLAWRDGEGAGWDFLPGSPAS